MEYQPCINHNSKLSCMFLIISLQWVSLALESNVSLEIYVKTVMQSVEMASVNVIQLVISLTAPLARNAVSRNCSQLLI